MTEDNDVLQDENTDNPGEAEPTPGEFTAYCNRFYRLTELLAAQEQNLSKMLDNAPAYEGQTRLSEIDTIIQYYREVQAASTETKATADDLGKTGATIRQIMEHFEIPPGTMLTGEIPGEVAYTIWAGEDDALFIGKTKDLVPVKVDANIIEIKIFAPLVVKPTGRRGRGNK